MKVQVLRSSYSIPVYNAKGDTVRNVFIDFYQAIKEYHVNGSDETIKESDNKNYKYMYMSGGEKLYIKDLQITFIN